MNDVWKNLSPCFIISTGRTGTKFLTYFFKRLSNEIDARHEPSPKILKLKWQFGAGKISLEQAVRKFRKINYPLYNNLKKPIYIEASPQLRFLVPVITEVFQNYKIVYVIRDGRDWLRSGMNRGIYSSFIDKLPPNVIKFLRFIVPYNLQFPKSRLIKFQAYYRDLWRFTTNDFEKDSNYMLWSQMTQFEKLAWMWSKYNKSIYKDIKGNKNIITVKFEDIFNENNNYEAIKKIVNFLDLNRFWEENKLNLNDLFSKKINVSRTYKFPHWSNWRKEWIVKFEEIAGEMMKFYGYL